MAELNLKCPQVSGSDFPGLCYFPHFYRWNTRLVQVFWFCHCETDCFEAQWLKILLTIFRARNLAHGGQHRPLQ